MRHSCAACTAEPRSGRPAKSCSCHQDTPRQSQTRRTGYSFKEGLTMMAAKDVGIDPYLAADAGEGAKAALNHLRKATKAKYGPARTSYIKDAQAELKSISAAKHPKLVNAIQAKLLALQGRGGDTEIAHLTPGEVVIPRSMQTPALMKQIAALAAQRGLNPAQLSVGHSANNINPKTGQREFAIEGWRKSYWQGGRDEARDAEARELYGSIDVVAYNHNLNDYLNLYRGGEFTFTDPSVTSEPTMTGPENQAPFGSLPLLQSVLNDLTDDELVQLRFEIQHWANTFAATSVGVSTFPVLAARFLVSLSPAGLAVVAATSLGIGAASWALNTFVNHINLELSDRGLQSGPQGP